jgi:acyl-homoserine lactone acylase PvdQ
LRSGTALNTVVAMRRSGKTTQARAADVQAVKEAERLRQAAEQLARAVEEFLRRRAPLHTSLECRDGQVEPLDWSAAGCESLCPLCLLNRALSIYRMRA